jgi:hypothetical protein
VPDLELYIVNVWPSKEATNQLPVDYDSLKDRKNDLTYHDKTGYDIKVAEMVNDYIDYINELSTVAEEAISSVQNAAKRKELTKRLEGIGRPDTEFKEARRRSKNTGIQGPFGRPIQAGKGCKDRTQRRYLQYFK